MNWKTKDFLLLPLCLVFTLLFSFTLFGWIGGAFTEFNFFEITGNLLLSGGIALFTFLLLFED